MTNEQKKEAIYELARTLPPEDFDDIVDRLQDVLIEKLVDVLKVEDDGVGVQEAEEGATA